jgi:glycerol-3-phosphate acyltransferase PlsY
VGSFPTGLVDSKLARGIDVRQYGSGNTGATNVLRTLGPVAFVIVFLGDFLKGLAPVLLAVWLIGTPLAQVMAGLAAMGGHNWSVFLRFSGGRGVATGIGALWGIAPLIAALVTAVTVTIILLSRYVSLGSIVGAGVAIAGMLVAVLLGADRTEYLLYAVPGALIVIARHRENIQRLLRGTERKIGEPALPRSPIA